MKVNMELAEKHLLDDEAEARAYIVQMWAEAMEIYRSGNFKLCFSKEMHEQVIARQLEFMPEDSVAGQIEAYLESYTGELVCSKQLYAEAIATSSFDEPKQWQLREINDIMNHSIEGWKAFTNPRHFPASYFRQRGWERIKPPDNADGGFREITKAEQLSLPFDVDDQ